MVRTNATVIGALAVSAGDADALICGLEGRYARHLRDVGQIIGRREGVHDFSALSLIMISQRGATFLTDTYVTFDPSAEEIAEMTVLAAQEIRRFGIEPKAALLSHSNFGSRDSASAIKMREALAIVRTRSRTGSRRRNARRCRLVRNAAPARHAEFALKGEANLLVFPNLDAANIALGIVKTMTDALHVGPILLGTALPAHILSPSVTSRGVVNMATLAVVESNTTSDSKNLP